MKKFSIASAPGKIHLIGEHSSVYGKPAILAAINKRIFVRVSKSSKKQKNGALLRIQKYLYKKYKVPVENLEIETNGDLPSGRGLGSSASYSAALTAALFDLYRLKFDLDEIFNASYEGEKFFHGNPSGGDLATVVFGGILWFRKESDEIKLFKKLNIKKKFSFFAVDSGKAYESTKDMVMSVSILPKKRLDNFCNEQEILTKQMAEQIINGLDISKTLKNAQKNLEKIGVVGLQAKKIIKDLNSMGFSAKISGGGGFKKGSGMLFVTNPKKKKYDALKDLGLIVLKLEIENDGVRIENP